ncbi:ThiF family adenylyltransferase [Novosphingobium sp. PY1]|uniref:ThiF family adenylyltransferase n=1 Tax=Novosphingobium sp. PY1 TaxID=1882221 RepID=UPI001A90BEF3|nr:ThiF family adenylyltransferase [Novosphingobium sp. PY1]GFM31605.1 Dinucleotide-utilizing enzymes [Novosphingobium sp. PY1]
MDTIRMTDGQHRRLAAHLYDGTGLEAVAVALCGRGGHAAHQVFTLHDIVEIPHDESERSVTSVTWRTRRLREILARAARDNLAVLKMHSHPTGHRDFSSLDDASDADLFSSVVLKVPGTHLSAVMLPDGEVFARTMLGGRTVHRVERVAVIGDEIRLYGACAEGGPRSEFDLRHRQAFGDHTADILAGMSIAVVGVSGTGSPVVEMLARLGVGRIVLIEFDVVEEKNLNRIWGSRRAHAEARLNKALMMKRYVEGIGLGTVVEVVDTSIDDPDAIAAVATCDVAVGCMDTFEGRDVLNRVATFYSMAYIDIGVRLDADGAGGIASMSAGVHYLKPGGSSLRSRGVYTDEDLRAEYLRRTDPAFYEDQVRRGYIRGAKVESPAVISINTAAAATAVNELLARLHPYRTRPNADFAVQKLLFSHGRTVTRPEGKPDDLLAPYVGRGDCVPMLMLPRIGRAA